MGSPYQNQTASGYSSSPPADDGSVTAANKIKYSTLKTQLGDPVKALADAINTALRAALNVTPTSQSSAYTTTPADHLRPIEVSGTTTISLGDAATMVAQSMGYTAIIQNTGTNTVTVSRITGANTLNGATKDIKLAPGQAVVCTVNSTSNGYDVISVANGVFMDATDPSKQIRFDLSGLTTGTTRVLTVSDLSSAIGKQPTRQVFTSGSGTYTTPAGCTRVNVRMIGGGGGGGGAGAAGSNGGSTTFSTLTASGGARNGGAAGTGTNGDVNINGGTGGGANSTNNTPGQKGGGTPFGDGACGGGSPGGGATSAPSNSGAGGGGGGGGASTPGSAGGSGGGYVEKLITSPSASYSYAVGAGGTGDNAGGTGGGVGNGGSGLIIVDEYYN